MVSKIILYLFAVAMCVFFALYLSAEIGWTVVYLLVVAPIFSFVVTLVTHRTKSVTLRADIDKSMLYKGETVTLRIIAKNRSILPVPAVRVRLAAAKGLEAETGAESFVISIPPRSEAVLEARYKARVWGTYKVGAVSAALWDFMGFFRFAMPADELACGVKIFPDIPEMQGDAPLLKSAAETAKFSDESEDTRESDGITRFAGMPGYTHREYAEGDPVRRINWKLSSKRDKYMVRLDDEIESVQQTIVLDSCGGDDVLENERAVEGMLAAALGLLKSGFDTTVFCRFNGAFEQFEITEPADVSALQTKLAEYSFETGSTAVKRLPESVTENGARTVILYTPRFDARLTAELSAAEEQGVFTAVVSSDSVGTGTAFQVWRLNEDYSPELIK
ncbi:MAG: DUF58 domain-containing protein [Oscillospiraceae bacterium]|nr:DUF58 domain-containing protein [Oscillospiraceae bacterium]